MLHVASSPGSSQCFNVLAREHLNDGRGGGDKAIYVYLHYVHNYIIILFIFRMSSSCTHVSALLHTLVAATLIEFTIRPTSSASNLEEDLPVTSYPCQWKALKNANRAPFALLILCLKNMCMAR